MEFGLTSTGSGTVTVSGLRRLVPWIAGTVGLLMASGATPQGNIDAGKSPAQMFADTCSNCHRRPSELKRTTAGFLRQHYTPGAQEAAAMASYLAGIPAAASPKDRPKGAIEKEKEKAKVQQQAQERPQAPQERSQPKTPQQPLPKAKRPELAKGPAGDPPADAPQEVRAEPPPVPKLEPFEE